MSQFRAGATILTLTNTTGSIWGIAWSPDSLRIATTSQDATARIWDAQTGRLLLTLAGHTEGVETAAWSPDNRFIATASRDTTARIWDATTGRALLTLAHTHPLHGIAWSPSGDAIVTA